MWARHRAGLQPEWYSRKLVFLYCSKAERTTSLHLLSSADYSQASEDNELLDCLCCCFRDTMEVFARDKQWLGQQGRDSSLHQTGSLRQGNSKAHERQGAARHDSRGKPRAQQGCDGHRRL